MPETLDDLFAAVTVDVATRTRPPGAREAIASTRRRTAGVLAAGATAAVVGVASLTMLDGDPDTIPDPAPAPAPPPATAVWYDAAGLHRGEAIEQTAVPLQTSWPEGGSVLTLVRTGALYLDQESNEVWFHPWDGEPRIVGHSQSGPAGDPEGDNAAWFDGDELVVLDTATGREVVRVVAPPVAPSSAGEHRLTGNGFLHVSSEEVVWTTRGRPEAVMGLDLRTRAVTEITREGFGLVDLHGDAEAWTETAERASDGSFEELPVTVRRPGAEDEEYEALEPRARISPDGRYLLAASVDPHGSAVVDLESGDWFRLPDRDQEYYAYIAWSYGDTALLLVRESRDLASTELLACAVEQRDCTTIDFSGKPPGLGDDIVLPS